ncbi:alpha/beta hydrolase [Schleiferilactobacillus shenzhenensis]|uniref:alpha/beta hydrolase n=1 Tax=Schleiferilactobacillus shenzhenensis TaxID=1231337 RepID=UPI000406FB46|nr:alpha/beta hydrolase [Schleiferilactobacillus shenzhenensis]
MEREGMNKVGSVLAGLAAGAFLLPVLTRLTKRRAAADTVEAQAQDRPDLPATGRFQSKQIPTLYVHGFRGGAHSTQQMVESAARATQQDSWLQVIYDSGEITYAGNWTSDLHPIVQVVFKDNWVGTRIISHYLEKILPALQEKFGFTQYNAVGHSVGATALVFAEMRNYDNPQFPKLNKLVLVGGPFDGVVALGDLPNFNRFTWTGRPILMNPTYLEMLLSRKRFPHDAKVLNVYGNINNGTNTDKYITVISAKSIRYILAPIVKSFSEIEVRGLPGEHSMMHDDSLVLKKINRFLYGQA